MVNWVSYFGPTLETKGGQISTETALEGKTRVAIYFSAHWCPPCRNFTPVLAEFYEQIVNENPSNLAIVFISSDSDDKSYREYYASMPWFSVQYKERTIAQALGKRFAINGIPALIVLDGTDGSTLDANGRATVGNAKGNVEQALAFWVKGKGGKCLIL